MLFKLWLISLKINPLQYLNIVKHKMIECDYSNDVHFSDDEKHKLYLIDNVNGQIFFGTNYTADDVMNSIALNNDLIKFEDKTRENKEWVDENIMPLVGKYGKFEPIIIEFYLLWT
jgi:hypothetical protein